MKAAIAVLVVLLLSFGAASVRACGPTLVCADVALSFIGILNSDNITLDWSTDDEPSSVGEYRLYRFNCGTPASCSTLVTTVQMAGSCGTDQAYEFVDSPPLPLGQWLYYLEVRKADQLIQCQVFVDPL